MAIPKRKLKKNDHYWDKEHVKLNEIDVQVVKEIGTGANLLIMAT